MAFSSNLKLNDPEYDAKIGTRPAGNAGALAPVYYRNNTYGNRVITSVLTSIPNNHAVCLQGRNNLGRVCGHVVAPDWDADNGSVVGGVVFEWDSTEGFGGDSGGAITGESKFESGCRDLHRTSQRPR
jgi:hypothetical protein